MMIHKQKIFLFKNISFKLSSLFFWRDLKNGNLTILLGCLIVSIGSISATQFLTNRIEFSLSKEIRTTLAADRRIVSDKKIISSWISAAEKMNFKIVKGSQFPSMAFSESDSVLVSVKSVTKNYPLRGNLIVSHKNKNKEIYSLSKLKSGEALIDPTLLSLLKINIGKKFFLGEKEFIAKGIIESEPDRGISFVNFSPRIIINESDLLDTGLIQTGSRVSYRLWVASDSSEKLKAFDEFVSKEIGPGQRIDTFESARPELNQALNKVKSFLSLIGLMTMIMASVAIGFSSRQLASKHYSSAVIMKVFGAESGTLKEIWKLELIFITLVGFVFGILFGYISQFILLQYINSFTEISLPKINVFSFSILIQCFSICSLLIAIFAWPVIFNVIKTPPSIAIRQPKTFTVGGLNFVNYSFTNVTFLLSGFFLLIYLTTSDFKLSLIVIFCFFVLVLIFYFVCYGILFFVSQFENVNLNKTSTVYWVLISFIRSSKRRSSSLCLQVVALGIAVSSVITSAYVKDSLITSWESATSENSPNHFLLNIQKDQKEEIISFLRKNNIGDTAIYPMVRARIKAINNVPINLDSYTSLRTQRLIKREINLSYGNSIPKHNKILRGVDINPDKPEVSVEESFAKLLKIKLGDKLTFSLEDKDLNVFVTSIRSLKWESMKVNFFMFLSRSVLLDQPQSFITSFRYENLNNNEETSNNNSFKNDLLDEFSNLTIVDLSLIVEQVKLLLSHAISAIQFLFSFSIISAFFVLWSSLLASKDERIREASILRVMGAPSYKLSAGQWFELILLGLLAGFIGALLSQVVGSIIFKYVFEGFSANFSYRLLVIGSITSILVSIFSGYFALKNVITSSTIRSLKNIS